MLQFFIIMYKLYSEKPAVLNIPHKYKIDSLLKANLARSNSSLPMNVLVSQLKLRGSQTDSLRLI